MQINIAIIGKNSYIGFNLIKDLKTKKKNKFIQLFLRRFQKNQKF